MTAIAWIYAPSGFALATDGRSRAIGNAPEELKNRPEDNAQKIFNAKFKGRDIAYAVTGATANNTGTFNIFTELDGSLSSANNCQSIYELMPRISTRLKAAFEKAKKDGRLPPSFPTDAGVAREDGTYAISEILFAGYFSRKRPSFATVRIVHATQVIAEPAVLFETPPQHNFYRGSDVIAQLLLEGKDQRLAKYFRPKLIYESPIEDVIVVAKNYIDACCDPLAITIDPICEAFGGHIHVATLTSGDGFKWVVPPLT